MLSFELAPPVRVTSNLVISLAQSITIGTSTLLSPSKAPDVVISGSYTVSGRPSPLLIWHWGLVTCIAIGRLTLAFCAAWQLNDVDALNNPTINGKNRHVLSIIGYLDSQTGGNIPCLERLARDLFRLQLELTKFLIFIAQCS